VIASLTCFFRVFKILGTRNGVGIRLYSVLFFQNVCHVLLAESVVAPVYLGKMSGILMIISFFPPVFIPKHIRKNEKMWKNGGECFHHIKKVAINVP